jgi:uncharacterized protein (DUF488 family)
VIYTAGYQGHLNTELLQAAKEHKALVIDIRLSSKSSIPGWSGEALRALMPDKYMHCPALGNKNYKGGPIELYDAARGIDFVEHMSKIRNVILLCCCKSPEKCHRTVIAGALEFFDLKCEELVWP